MDVAFSSLPVKPALEKGTSVCFLISPGRADTRFRWTFVFVISLTRFEPSILCEVWTWKFQLLLIGFPGSFLSYYLGRLLASQQGLVATVALFCALCSLRSLRSCPEQARLGPELDLTQVVQCTSLHIKPKWGLRRDLKKDRKEHGKGQSEGQSSGQCGHPNAQVNPLSGRLFVSYCFVLRTWAGGELLRGTLRTTAPFFKSIRSCQFMPCDTIWCDAAYEARGVTWCEVRTDETSLMCQASTEQKKREEMEREEQKKKNKTEEARAACLHIIPKDWYLISHASSLVASSCQVT